MVDGEVRRKKRKVRHRKPNHGITTNEFIRKFDELQADKSKFVKVVAKRDDYIAFKQEMSRRSPYTGIKFPQGSRLLAFHSFVAQKGSYEGTFNELKKNKVFGERTPSLKTLKNWGRQDHWDLIRRMVDDKVFDLMEMVEDPDMMAFLSEERTLFKFLMKLRSQVYMRMAEPNSSLIPQNSRDAITFLKFIEEMRDRFGARIDEVGDRTGTDIREEWDKERPADEKITRPKNVIDIMTALRAEGKVADQSSIAREMIKNRKAAAEE